MVRSTRRKASTAEIMARLDVAKPGWRELDENSDELIRAVADADRVGYLTAPGGAPYYGGAKPRPDVGMLVRQRDDERERDHVAALIENAWWDYRAGLRRLVAARVEARRLRIAGRELDDVQEASHRASEGLPPLDAGQIEQRGREREQADKDELWGWHHHDIASDERHRERVKKLRVRLAAPPTELEHQRHRLLRMRGK